MEKFILLSTVGKDVLITAKAAVIRATDHRFGKLSADSRHFSSCLVD